MSTTTITYACTIVTRDSRSDRHPCDVVAPSDATISDIAVAAVRKVFGASRGFYRDPGLPPSYGRITSAGPGGAIDLHDAIRVDVEMPAPAWRVVDRDDCTRVRWEGLDYEAAKAESDRLDAAGGDTVVVERRGRTWSEERPEMVYG